MASAPRQRAAAEIGPTAEAAWSAAGSRTPERCEALVLGLDVGGSTSRALLATASGERLGEGRAGGGNPLSRGIGPAVAAVAAAVSEALADVDPASVRAVAIGMAGGGRVDRTESDVSAALDRMWKSAGITCRIDYVGDALVAFAGGTADPDGSLLISGTGAVAVSVAGREMAARADGHGWLLGDRGSGFWLGREAVIAVLADLDGRGPGTALTPLVLAALEMPGRPLAEEVVLDVADRKPVALAALAPAVTEACALGDAVALRIAETAAGHLLETLGEVRAAGEDTPVVMGGSILIHETPVAAAVRSGVRRLWPDAELRTATDGAAGAAWLAALTLADGGPSDARASHARLVGTAPCVAA